MSTTTVAPPIPYAGYVQSNMISPAVPFVDGTGMIAPVNWRFLYSVFTAVNQAYQQMTTEFTNVEAQLKAIYDQQQINMTDIANLKTETTNLVNSVNAIDAEIVTINSTLTSLQTQINTINSRLATAGIP